MKGLRRVIVSDALVAQVFTVGRIFESQKVTSGIPSGSKLVGMEHPALHFGAPQIGATAFIFEHESFPVTESGEIPTVPWMLKGVN